MTYNILILNLNLSTKQIIHLKKFYNLIFFKKKIIYKNLNLYGNFIFLKKISTFINFKLYNIIPITYIYKNIYLSTNKYNKIKINKTFQKQVLQFIKILK